MPNMPNVYATDTSLAAHLLALIELVGRMDLTFEEWDAKVDRILSRMMAEDLRRQMLGIPSFHR
jgi:hypothetical protein